MKHPTGIRLLCCDVEGVLTDGTVIQSSGGQQRFLSSYNAQDALGLTLLKQAGVKLAAISGRHDAVAAQLLDAMGFDHIILGESDKEAALNRIVVASKIDKARIAFVGDDVDDLPALRQCAACFAPMNAVAAVKAEDGVIVVHRRGGQGAVREVASEILQGLEVESLTQLADQDLV